MQSLVRIISVISAHCDVRGMNGGAFRWPGISDSRAKILRDAPHNTGIYNSGRIYPFRGGVTIVAPLIVPRMYNKQRHNPPCAFTCLIYDLPAIVSRRDGRGRMGHRGRREAGENL